MDADSRIVRVEGRPVKVERGRFGVSLHAVERGYFPVSSTGFFSLTGFGWGESGSLVEQEILEKRAREETRNRRQLMSDVAAVGRNKGKENGFSSVSALAERAFDYGFFAPHEDRVMLWRGSHRLLSVIENDPQFQPEPHPGVWTAEHCAKEMQKLRDLHAMLRRVADASFVIEPPWGAFGAKAYLRLPSKLPEERRIELGVAAVETTFGLAQEQVLRPRERRREKETPSLSVASEQLDLFGTALRIEPESRAQAVKNPSGRLAT